MLFQSAVSRLRLETIAILLAVGADMHQEDDSGL